MEIINLFASFLDAWVNLIVGLLTALQTFFDGL